MPFSVFSSFAAARDLEEIIHSLAGHDTPEKAEHVLPLMEKAFNRLLDSPTRGARPKELLPLGIREFREILFKPYRITYQVDGGAVTIPLIADGRRDLRALLQRRLLEDSPIPRASQRSEHPADRD